MAEDPSVQGIIMVGDATDPSSIANVGAIGAVSGSQASTTPPKATKKRKTPDPVQNSAFSSVHTLDADASKPTTPRGQALDLSPTPTTAASTTQPNTAESAQPSTVALTWDAATIMIKDMTPSTASDWVLHARVIARGPVRNWTNLRGGGTLQELFLVDKNNDFIRATLFNGAVNKFNDATNPGSTCSLSGGKIKFNIGSSSTSTREYHLSFGEDASIRVIDPDAFGNAIPTIACTQLAGLTQLRAKTSVNVMGILVQATSTKRVVSAQGKNRQKRELVLIDDSNVRVLCTVWGNNARDDLDQAEGHPILIKGGQIDDYMGTRSIAANIGSSFIVSPVLPRAAELSAWFDNGVDHTAFPIVQSP